MDEEMGNYAEMIDTTRCNYQAKDFDDEEDEACQFQYAKYLSMKDVVEEPFVT